MVQMLPRSRRSGINVSQSGALPKGTSSYEVLAALQETYGAVRYTDQQMLRYPYYSRIAYPAAGASQLTFFGQNMGQATELLTNAEMVGALGNVSFLITGIYFDFWVSAPATTDQPNIYTTDATAIACDVLHGFTQAGYFEFTVGNLKWDQCPLPFLYRPPSNGRVRTAINAGGFAFTQAGLTPFGVTGAQTSLAYADLNRRLYSRGNLQNPLFLAPQQNFTAQISYPNGLVPIIATTAIGEGSVLYVECTLDGWKYTPVG